MRFPPAASRSMSSSQEGQKPNGKHRALSTEMDPDQKTGVIDSVKMRKDPKGGWFGPKLRDVYPEGEDTPVLFCDSGPSFPTGNLVTVFYREVRSTPDSSACKEAVAVVEGKAVWKDGKPVTMVELAQMKTQAAPRQRWPPHPSFS